MARKASNTADYFPHIAKTGKTLTILEGRWGLAGYAFWFKLLEILTSSEGHFYDCNIIENWEYLVQKCKLDGISVTEILNLLSKMGNLDQELWSKKIIWCQALVNNLADVYKKRQREIPSRPIPGPEMRAEEDSWPRNDSTEVMNASTEGISEPEVHKVKKSKVKDIIYSIPGPEMIGPIGPPPTVEKTDAPLEALPEEPKKDRFIFHLLKDAFLQKNFDFDFARECPHIENLEKRCLARPDPETFARTLLATFEQMTESQDKLFAGKPFLPSILNSKGLFPYVEKAMKNRMRDGPPPFVTAEKPTEVEWEQAAEAAKELADRFGVKPIPDF